MVSTLVVGTNTYVTRAEANTYLGDALGSESWAFLSPDDQDKALLTAFKLLERQLWQGEAVGAVDWPRTGVIDCAGDPVDDASVPTDIKSAQIELAYAISVDNTLASKTTTEDNISRLQAGSASIEFFNNGTADPFGAGRFPSNVMELIRCFLEGAGGSTGGAESFGTECPTDLDPARYDFNQPQ
jgi:hypothetical protein